MSTAAITDEVKSEPKTVPIPNEGDAEYKRIAINAKACMYEAELATVRDAQVFFNTSDIKLLVSDEVGAFGYDRKERCIIINDKRTISPVILYGIVYNVVAAPSTEELCVKETLKALYERLPSWADVFATEILRGFTSSNIYVLGILQFLGENNVGVEVYFDRFKADSENVLCIAKFSNSPLFQRVVVIYTGGGLAVDSLRQLSNSLSFFSRTCNVVGVVNVGPELTTRCGPNDYVYQITPVIIDRCRATL